MADRDFIVKNGLVVANGNLSITDKIVHSGDSDTAIRFPAANTVTVDTNGSERLRVDSAGNVGIGKYPTTKLDVNGTVTATTFVGTFTGVLDSADVVFIVDSNYILSRINNLADTKLATISTAGKVSNSATTATSANTASAIVARDGSGNFSAGTITAALSGNASTATTLQTARTIAISGDVTGSATSFNGSANITISAGITAGSIVSADFSSATSLIIYNSAGSAVKTIYSPGS